MPLWYVGTKTMPITRYFLLSLVLLTWTASPGAAQNTTATVRSSTR